MLKAQNRSTTRRREKSDGNEDDDVVCSIPRKKNGERECCSQKGLKGVE